MAEQDGVVAQVGEENGETSGSEVQTADQNGQAAQADRPREPEENRLGGWSIVKTLVVRTIIIYAISSFFRRGTTPTPPAEGNPGSPTAVSVGTSLPSMNAFMKNQELDLYVYLSEQEYFSDFNDKNALFWMEEELVYGDWTSGTEKDGSYTKTKELQLSQNMMNNGSMYLHVFIVKAGHSPDPSDKDTFDRLHTLHESKMLNRFKKRKFHNMVNLLTGESEVHPDLLRLGNETQMEILSHWHPNLTLNLIDDHTPWTKGMVPSPLDESIHFIPGTDKYYPILFFNDYWNLNSDFMPINETTPTVNLSLTYAPMSLFKWQMYAAQSMRSKWYSILGEDMMEESDDDQDTLKVMFLETSPYLLALTIIVSIVHSVFEFMAFKNDIQFWKSRKSMEGLSVRSVFFNVFQSLIVCLYVLDNETNFMVRCTVFIGLAIEVWKIFKVIDVKLDRENLIAGLIPRVKFEDKSTYTQSDTKKYDQLAFKYLSWLLFPLLVGYGVYSMLYNEHKGWYSFILNMIYGFLLMFGFIMMTPQLFINYKLKSVAHLPWRMLTYKALNTFIDDLFAFVIKMPTLYRIGCFRDDIVFVIFLYQRYKYRVDPKRLNEFGTSGEMDQPNGDVAVDNGVENAAVTSSNGEAKAIENGSPKSGEGSKKSGGSPKKADGTKEDKKSKHKSKNKKAKKDD